MAAEHNFSDDVAVREKPFAAHAQFEGGEGEGGFAEVKREFFVESRIGRVLNCLTPLAPRLASVRQQRHFDEHTCQIISNESC